MTPMPGGELASRPLHFIWLVDCSGSMGLKGKMQILNTAIHEALPEMKNVADENPNAQVLVRAIKFSNGAQWLVSQPTDIAHFSWIDLTADGMTDMGKALSLVAEQLDVSKMGERALPPVLVLLSDGEPTDDFDGGLKELLSKPWGKRAVRIAIAIGAKDDNFDVLQKFIDNPERALLYAENAEQLVSYIKWASTAVLKAASQPASQSQGSTTLGSNVPIPQPPDKDNFANLDEPW